jgi:hypothetical protein
MAIPWMHDFQNAMRVGEVGLIGPCERIYVAWSKISIVQSSQHRRVVKIGTVPSKHGLPKQSHKADSESLTREVVLYSVYSTHRRSALSPMSAYLKGLVEARWAIHRPHLPFINVNPGLHSASCYRRGALGERRLPSAPGRSLWNRSMTYTRSIQVSRIRSRRRNSYSTGSTAFLSKE